ncbi:hypothetical protein [Lysobacter capsici]|uniref:hypothetical protein n=1 Tax=Lysobacter capsici TaxID=435897 RepID=UPI001F2CF05F|nr:hypothetical protein [Lysobacter capsici]WND81022.1 hypothetical protein RJ610_01190 [Lysobacter capsici]WND86218.1 hypothetical protein RJ609_01190 [Lysobacter capsici]
MPASKANNSAFAIARLNAACGERGCADRAIDVLGPFDELRIARPRRGSMLMTNQAASSPIASRHTVANAIGVVTRPVVG